MNVYDLTQARLDIIFKNFDYVYVSFSGGKDSGALLNLCIDFIRNHDLKRKIGVFHIDYEAQYQMTTDYVNSVFEKNLDIIDVYRICLPIAAQCVTSMHQSYWIPWDTDNIDLWVRDMPKVSIREDNHEFDWFKKGMWDYELQARFGEWIRRKEGSHRTCCLVGIRTQESLNRWRTIHSDKNYRNFKGIQWTSKIHEKVFNAYPIFDWAVEDIWTLNAKFGYEYNKLYDLFYQAGMKLNQMRVASPFNDCAMDSLKYYKVIDPKNWAKMIGRVNGVNFAGLYGGTTAMGWRSIKLPKGHTWKSYMEFLLNTMPKDASENYKKKLQISIKFWREKGGVLSENVIDKLRQLGIHHEIGPKTNYKTDKMPVKMEYLDDIDIDEFKEIPSYKRMSVCIMKNDHLCKYMGFSLSKTETELRSKAEKSYKNILEATND